MPKIKYSETISHPNRKGPSLLTLLSKLGQCHHNSLEWDRTIQRTHFKRRRPQVNSEFYNNDDKLLFVIPKMYCNSECYNSYFKV